MAINRIILFILGDNARARDRRVDYTAKELQNEMNAAVVQIHGKEGETAFRTVIFNGKEFDCMDPSTAIQRVRADPTLHNNPGINAQLVRCIYLMNCALEPSEWAECIKQVGNALNNNNFQSCEQIALIQKDGQDVSDPELMEALSDANFAVYLFSQNTKPGYILSSAAEEKKLLSSYAALAAGTDGFPRGAGVYVGSYEKLCLMDRDFERIGRHYIVKGLTGALGGNVPDENILFSMLLGVWMSSAGEINANSDTVQVSRMMKQKLREKGCLLNRLWFSLLAGTSDEATRENVESFIKLNMDRYDSWLETQKRRLDNEKTEARSAYLLVKDWIDFLDQTLDSHPEYYHERVISDVEDSLVKSLNRWASELEGVNLNNDNMSYGESDEILFAIDYTEKRLEPYYDRLCGHVLRHMARVLETKSKDMRTAIQARDALINQKQWLVNEQEIADDRRYAEIIIDNIQSHCQNLSPGSLKPSSKFFNKNNMSDMAQNWNKRIESQLDEMRKKRLLNDTLIGTLNDTLTADFTVAVTRCLSRIGIRCALPQDVLKEDERALIYICDSGLIATGQRELPGHDRATYIQPKQVAGLKNLFKFEISQVSRIVVVPDRVVDTDQPVPDEPRTTIRDILAKVPMSNRMAVADVERPARDTTNPGDDQPPKAPTEPENDGRQSAGNHCGCRVEDKNFVIMIPNEVMCQDINSNSEVKYTLYGYDRFGTRRLPIDGQISVQGSELRIPLEGVYGRCRVEVRPATFQYTADLEFDGPRSNDYVYYVKKRPWVLRKTHACTIEGTQYVFKRWKCAFTDKTARKTRIRLSKSDLRYPIGEAQRWDIWVPEDESCGNFYLETNDDACVLEMKEKD